MVGQRLADQAERADVEPVAPRRHAGPSRRGAAAPHRRAPPTMRRHVPSTSWWSMRSATACPRRRPRPRRAAPAVLRSEERPVEEAQVGHAGQLPSNTGFCLRREGPVGAAEILRLHAERLGDGLGLDGVVDAHRPFHLQHALGEAGARNSGRRRGCRASSGRRGAGRSAAAHEPVEEAPALAFLARHGAAGEQQFARAALADDAGQDARRRPCRSRRGRRG